MPGTSFCTEHLLLDMYDKDLFVLLLCLTFYINSLISVLVIKRVCRVEEPGTRQEFSLYIRDIMCLPLQITYFDT